VPVLARLLESAGIATILVSMMPYFAELSGVPRTLAVEFPFGQTMGHDTAQQSRVVRIIVHSEEEWPVPQKEAYKTWQPSEASPIIAVIAPQLREMLRKKSD